MDKKFVYAFRQGEADGSASMKELLGGKGANLAEMAGLGLPVPPGFTITTEACNHYLTNGNRFPEGLEEQVENEIETLVSLMNGLLGWVFLVSVRSGARASMPGMMDTILNLGLNDGTVEAFAKHTGNPRLAWDNYRRLIEMYSAIVFGIPREHFTEALEAAKKGKGVAYDWMLDVEELRKLVDTYKGIVLKYAHRAFPQDIREQLWGAIGAVFESWMCKRAIKYREIHGLPDDWGTAVNIQVMVFGNMNERSATGVAFTANPSTGEPVFFGEYLPMAQGEEVVAGIRTPHAITEKERVAKGHEHASLETVMPEVFDEFKRYAEILRRHFLDLQDMEFTIMDGDLYFLQCRSGKRSAQAAFRIAVDMVHEGLITMENAIMRITSDQHDQILHPMIDPNAIYTIITQGLPASPGAACGEIVFSPEEARRHKKDGRKVILVRIETSPEDIDGMHAAEGILTARGGMTSHAALVARGMGKPCVCGAEAIQIDYENKCFVVGGKRYSMGDTITLDGSSGRVLNGRVPMINAEPTAEYLELMQWADKTRRLKVRANAETPEDARTARRHGAEGIGLSRTEHMFFEGERIVAVREMILADDAQGRLRALAKILPMQRDDFKEIFTIMSGLPVTIRLLDPPLHEFLPHTEAEIRNVAWAMKVDPEKLRQRAHQLGEFNPMLGFRGVRLAIAYPEIAQMQARAIL